MAACRQCGKRNPEGFAFCGDCAASLAQAKPPGTAPSSAPPIDGKSKGGRIELLPWSELSAIQKGGRAAAGVVVLVLILCFMRGFLSNVGASNLSAASQSSEGPLTDNDRKDGIASLCKVFQIYGIPQDQKNAVGSAKNAASMFKLGDDQSPERSSFILTMIAGEFRAGKLSDQDCAEVGEPLAKVASHVRDPPPASMKHNTHSTIS